jgi:porin
MTIGYYWGVKFRPTALALVGAAGLASAAAAQVPAPPSYTPPGPHSSWEQFGQQLLNEGVFLRSTYTGDYSGNVAGGLRQGSDYADEANIGADINMQTLAGIPGGAIHITVSGRTGRDISIDDVGNNVLANQIYGGQSIRLSELTWDQALFHDRVDIVAGRMNSAIFGNSPTNCNFMTNAICGHVDSLFRAVGLISYPYAAWGGRATFRGTPTTSLMIGAFEVNPKQSAYGRDDLNFTLQNDTGVVLPVELDYATNFKQSDYPTSLEFGGYYDTSKYKDPAYNTKDQAIALDHGTAATHFGRTGIYTFVNQVVYRPDLLNARNLRVFGGFTHSLDEPEEIQWGGDVGMLYTGPFASRPLDAIGAIGTVMHFGGRELTYLKEERALAGGTGTPAANEYVFEVNYGIQANDWLRVLPNFQYVANPDSLAQPKQAKQTPNAVIFGVQLTVNLVRLAGLPQEVFSH